MGVEPLSGRASWILHAIAKAIMALLRARRRGVDCCRVRSTLKSPISVSAFGHLAIMSSRVSLGSENGMYTISREVLRHVTCTPSTNG